MKRYLVILPFVAILAMQKFVCAGSDEGIAVVERYIADTKRWKPREYKIEKQRQEKGCTFTWFAFLLTRSWLTPAAASLLRRITIQRRDGLLKPCISSEVSNPYQARAVNRQKSS